MIDCTLNGVACTAYARRDGDEITIRVDGLPEAILRGGYLHIVGTVADEDAEMVRAANTAYFAGTLRWQDPAGRDCIVAEEDFGTDRVRPTIGALRAAWRQSRMWAGFGLAPCSLRARICAAWAAATTRNRSGWIARPLSEVGLALGATWQQCGFDPAEAAALAKAHGKPEPLYA